MAYPASLGDVECWLGTQNQDGRGRLRCMAATHTDRDHAFSHFSEETVSSRLVSRVLSPSCRVHIGAVAIPWLSNPATLVTSLL